MAAPADFLNFVDTNKDRFIQRLARAVEIPRYRIVSTRWVRPPMLIRTSVSGDPAHRDDVFRMSSYLESQLRQYGVETKAVELGTHIMDGHNLKLPPAVLGRIGDDKSKKTILIYGHFDVQPVCRLPFSDSSSPS
jgi:Cys-Gly metallodipeptidase DUG1